MEKVYSLATDTINETAIQKLYSLHFQRRRVSWHLPGQCGRWPGGSCHQEHWKAWEMNYPTSFHCSSTDHCSLVSPRLDRDIHWLLEIPVKHLGWQCVSAVGGALWTEEKGLVGRRANVENGPGNQGQFNDSTLFTKRIRLHCAYMFFPNLIIDLPPRCFSGSSYLVSSATERPRDGPVRTTRPWTCEKVFY